MGKFSTGLFAGAVIGMGIAMFDKRTMKYAKKAMKNAIRTCHHM